MRIDSSGNALIGQTSNSETGTGIGLVPDGTSHMYSGNTDTLMLGRGGSDGDILSFNKSGTTVGSIGTYVNLPYIGKNDVNLLFDPAGPHVIPRGTNGGARDGAINLGSSSNNFKDAHFSGTGYFGTRVGIGTTSPSSKLHVQGTSFFFDQAVFDDKVGIGTSSPSAKMHLYKNDSNNEIVRFEQAATARGSQILFKNPHNSSFYFGIAGDSTGDTIHYNGANTNSLFYTNGSERMRIDSSGRVGIGTSSPDSALHVAGTGQEDITVTSSHSSYANWSGLRLYNTNDSANGTNTAPSFRIKNFTSNAGVLIENEKASTIEFKTNNNSDQLVLQSNGNVGINKNNPSEKLEVNGTVKATAFVGDGSGLTGISGGGGSTGPAFFAKKHASASGPPQYVSPNTNTKVTFGIEEIDTDSDFTNSRFTPGTAGYYWIHANLVCACGAGAANAKIYKNGSLLITSNYVEEQNYTAKLTVSGLVYLNGSTDYVEAYVLLQNAPGSSSNASVQLNQSTYFTGFLAR